MTTTGPGRAPEPGDVAVTQAVAAATGELPRSVAPVSGGDLANAWRVELANGAVFAKSMDDAPPGTLATEAAGLNWLRVEARVSVPEVIAVDDHVLVLEWVEPGRRTFTAAQRLGHGLAVVHLEGADAFGSVPPGGGSAGFLARLGVELSPVADWPNFITTQRWEPLAREAERRGAIPATTRTAIDRLCERVRNPASGLAGPPERPARIHGDLWAGNVIWGRDDRPWLIDPAAHGGHRESDLAMMRLFGGYPDEVFAAYHEAFPIAEGWEERVALHQLDPLLVHACLFGGGYGTRVAEIVTGYT